MILSVTLFFSIVLEANAQNDLVVIKHHYYTSWFSTSEHIPIVVTYTLANSMLDCGQHIGRAKRFTPDPDYKQITNLNRDYKNSGYDRGHNMNADDNHCDSVGMRECFYSSNMTPQPHSFNAGKWEELEKEERMLAEQNQSVIVTCGSLGKQDSIGEDHVIVPKWMWKVIYVPTSKQYYCYVFPNTDNVHENLDHYVVKITDIEHMANVSFTNGSVNVKSHK